MKTIEKRGRSLQNIINDFKSEYGISDYDFSYKIIQEPKKPLLGFIGGKKAIIEFKISNLAENITDYIREFCIYSQVTFQDIEIRGDEDYIYVDITGVSDPGFFIGKDGKFLKSLQYILNQTFPSQDPNNRPILLDIENYKQRQKELIISKVKSMAQKVVKTRKNITLDPMSPDQRRTVHQALRNNKDIRTMTIGDGSQKRIVLCHNNTNNNQAKRTRQKPISNDKNKVPKKRH